MPTSLTSILPYFLGFILLYLTSEAIQNKRRIRCSYRTKAKTKIYKWAKKSKSGGWNDIEFEGGLYHVEPDRITTEYITYLGFFPMPVMSLDFRHDSARALHPNTFENAYTPEQRRQLNIADDVRDFANGNANAIGGKVKKGMLEGFMPIIMIIGFLIVGYLVYMQGKNISMLGNGQNYLEQQISIIKQQTSGR